MRDVVSEHCRILAGDVLAHLAVDRIGRAERSHTHGERDAKLNGGG